MVPFPGNCCLKSGNKDRISMDRNEEEEFISGVVEGKFKRGTILTSALCFVLKMMDYKFYIDVLFYRVLWKTVDI
jgi:hypothetical protein